MFKFFCFLIPFISIASFLSQAQEYQIPNDPLGRPAYENNKVLIKLTKKAFTEFEDNSSIYLIPELQNLLNKYPVNDINHLNPVTKISPETQKRKSLARYFQLEFENQINVLDLVDLFIELNSVELAEPCYINYLNDEPNDPDYDDQGFLQQIRCPDAWDIHKGEEGDEEVLIGICDSGTDWDHSDLIDNLYQNLGEDIDGDGRVIEYIDDQWQFDPDDINYIDDDGNGKVDDFIGWNFAFYDGSVPNDPDASVQNNHGTHVAGLSAAVTNNNNGISSVSWNIKFLSTKHGLNSGGANLYNTYDGIIYLVDMNVDAINCSWGNYYYTAYGKEAIDYAIEEGVVVFASAGNGSTNEFLHYPSAYPKVINVASVNFDDSKASYSDYGIAIDICAPGSSIYSTISSNDYGYNSGTSMAAPIATGAFALLRSYRDDWTNNQLLRQLLGSTQDISDENPGIENEIGFGRLDVHAALATDNADVPEYLKLLMDDRFIDENHDQVYAAGEEVDIVVYLMNFNQFYGSDEVNYTVSCDQEFIDIYNGTGTFSIGAAEDKTVQAGYFSIDQDAEDTDEFEIVFEFDCDEGINIGSSYSYRFNVNNGGVKKAFAYLLEDESQDPYLRGPYSFDLDDPDYFESSSNEFIDDMPSAGTWYDGKWLVSEFSSKRLFNINILNSERYNFVKTKHHCHGMAFDPQSGLVYGVLSSTLCIIDPYSGIFHEIGMSIGRDYINLACSRDGVLYAVDKRSDYLGSINKTNGEFTELFTLGYDFNDFQGMEYDLDNDLLYIAAYPVVEDSFLGIIDVENETINVVGSFSNSVKMDCLAIPYSRTPFVQRLPYHLSILQSTKPEFSWTEELRADSYDLIVSEEADLSNPLIDVNISSTEYINPGNLDYGTKYYWKVIAKDGDVIIDETMIWEFTTVYQCYEEPIDTDGNGYRNISDLCHLRWLEQNSFYWDEKYELDNDIDASDTENWNVGDHDNDPFTDEVPMGWNPIGYFDVSINDLAFTGEFNGNGHSITDLFINRPGYDNIGFLGCISSNGRVYDLNIEDSHITGDECVGILAGVVFAHNTDSETYITINDCNTSGTITGNNRVGGFTGYNYAVNGSIEYIVCSSDVDVLLNDGEEYDLIGGFAGYSYSEGYVEFNYCRSFGNITINTMGEVDKVGGFVGSSNNVFITGCSSTIDIDILNTDYAYAAGGFAGFLQYSEVENSFARGNSSGASRIGGFCGYNFMSSIHHCYSTGRADGGNSGGFCGMNNSDISDCYWDVETSDLTNSAGGTGKTTTEMQDPETYENWNFDDFWDISVDDNDGYPFIGDIISKPLDEYYFDGTYSDYDEISDEGTVHIGGYSSAQIIENVDLGFDFQYCGQSFDRINISTNGYLQFGNFIEQYHLGPISKGMKYVISGLGRDLRFLSEDAELRSLTEGTVPDRVFTVQYKNLVDGYTPYYSVDSEINFQIRLYESDNSIEFIYGDFNYDFSNLAKYNVGFSGFDKNDYYNRRVDLQENNWENSFNGTNVNDRCDISKSIKPSLGLSYKWTPTNTIDLEKPILSSPENSDTDLSQNLKFEWKDVFGGLVYTLQVSENEDFDDMIVNEEINVTYFKVTGLKKNTTYFWRVKAQNSYMESDWSEIWSFTTEKYECPWTVNDETGNNADIIVPADIEPKIFNRDFVNGDAIGAFYTDAEDDLICAGYGVWEGDDLEISVWGDNDQTTEKDGYSIGEEYTLLAWDALKGRELESEFTIASGPDNYQIDAVTTLGSFQGGILDLQTIDLIEGWNMISSFLIPENGDIEQICNDIEEDMLLIKNVEGDMYFPSLDVNTLGSWYFDEGYKIYMMDDIQFDIYGGKVSPENTAIELQTGWRIIPYLRDSEMSVVTCLEDIDGDYLIIKDIDGNMYFPALNINTLGNLMPGKGYMIYITDECTLTYPSNDFPKVVMVEKALTPKADYIQPIMSNTGKNMTLILQTDEKYNHYEIGVKNEKGQIIGSGRVNEGIAAISIWGDNAMTSKIDGAIQNEELTVFVSGKGNYKQNLDLSFISSMIYNENYNELRYRTDDIILAKLLINGKSLENNTIFACDPNPSTGETYIKFSLEQGSSVSLNLFSMNGQLLEIIAQGNFIAGEYNIRLNAQKYSSGYYILRLITENNIQEEILIITK